MRVHSHTVAHTHPLQNCSLANTPTQIMHLHLQSFKRLCLVQFSSYTYLSFFLSPLSSCVWFSVDSYPLFHSHHFTVNLWHQILNSGLDLLFLASDTLLLNNPLLHFNYQADMNVMRLSYRIQPTKTEQYVPLNDEFFFMRSSLRSIQVKIRRERETKREKERKERERRGKGERQTERKKGQGGERRRRGKKGMQEHNAVVCIQMIERVMTIIEAESTEKEHLTLHHAFGEGTTQNGETRRNDNETKPFSWFSFLFQLLQLQKAL